MNEVRSDEIALWIHSLRPWADFATLTFAGHPVGQHAAAMHFKYFMQDHARGCSYFVAFEPNPGRAGYHAHALLHALEQQRKALWQDWFQQHGRNRIEPIESKGDVVSYCAKYVTKNKDAWWDLKLYPLAA
jgi:hypothetical protein